MPTESTLLFLLLFGLGLLLLTWMSSQIGLLIQENVYLLTTSSYMAMLVLFFIYLPGIIIHEGAHWAMARLLGLKTGKFRVWPQRRGRQIGMGSVAVARGGAFLDSLVGLAPLIVGSVLVAWIGRHVFNTLHIGSIWLEGDWRGAVGAVFASLRQQEDGLLWGYVIFAIANAMMPSKSDREPLKALLLYLLCFCGLYLLVDRSGTLLIQLTTWIVVPLQTLGSAILFTLVLDAIIVAVLVLLRSLLLRLHPLPTRSRSA